MLIKSHIHDLADALDDHNFPASKSVQLYFARSDDGEVVLLSTSPLTEQQLEDLNEFED